MKCQAKHQVLDLKLDGEKPAKGPQRARGKCSNCGGKMVCFLKHNFDRSLFQASSDLPK